MAKFIVGVMGGGETATEEHCRWAYRLGELIAREGWVLLNGGQATTPEEAIGIIKRKHGGGSHASV